MKNKSGSKKISIGLIVLLFIISFGPRQLSALSFEKKETVISPIEFDTKKDLLPILPEEEEETPGIKVIATSTTNTEEEEVSDERDRTNETETGVSEELIIPSAGLGTKIDKDESPEVTEEIPPLDLNEYEKVENLNKDDDDKNNEGLGLVEPEDSKEIEVSESAKQIDVSKILEDVGAKLEVCNLDNGCSGDMGVNHWMMEAEIYNDDKKKEFRFATDDAEIKQGILQISYFSFATENPQIIYSGAIDRGVNNFDFGILSSSNVLDDKIKDELKSNTATVAVEIETKEKSSTISKIKNFFSKIFSFINKSFKKINNFFSEAKPVLEQKSPIGDMVYNTYYLRVMPVKDSVVAGKASNEVKVSLKERPEQADVEIFTPAKLYEVKIIDFKPIRASEPGVCNGAMILDTDWDEYTGTTVIKHKAGERICPKGYKGIGEQAWYESLWNFAKSGMNWVSEAYNQLKASVVDGLAGLACGGDDDCRMAISAGLDIGLAAMGVPPSITNFDELVDGGFDYLAAEIASQAGCPDVVCKEKIKNELRNILEKQKNTNPNCKGEEEAHNDGLEPLFLPAGVKAHLDPLGTYRQAEITLEVTRTEADGSSLMGAPYKLQLNNYAYNDGLIGSSIHNIPPYGASVEITKALEGKMFESKTIILTEMQKGEKMNIPILLTPSEYWIPEHKEAMQGWSTVTYKDGIPQYQYDDWWKFYYEASLSFGAYIDGCLENYGASDCIISSDYLSVDLPGTLNP
ncbi:hypothetical protein C0583_00295 [Candidatus Parcubacteria bacterium]|nr:MAG: hypothetical protein C0583_00295 [Candidatus Parcubacteria bacterium]